MQSNFSTYSSLNVVINLLIVARHILDAKKLEKKYIIYAKEC